MCVLILEVDGFGIVGVALAQKGRGRGVCSTEALLTEYKYKYNHADVSNAMLLDSVTNNHAF